MERRRTYWASLNAALALALVAACAGAALATPAASAQTRSERPNIVVVLTDDQRWDTLSAMPTVQQELVAHGVTFTNSFVVNSLCCPSRTSLLTGQYSHSTGVYRNVPPHGGFPSFRDSRTIATVLHGAGYTTGLVGKYLNRYGVGTHDAHYVPPGWDHWTAFLGKTAYYNYRLVDQWTSYGWNVFTAENANDYAQVVAALKTMEDWDPRDRRSVVGSRLARPGRNPGGGWSRREERGGGGPGGRRGWRRRGAAPRGGARQ